MKLKIYGDSILKGVIYSDELKRYKLFGYRFEELAGRGIEVENNCKMGATVGEGIEIMKYSLGEDLRDTCVVMEFGGNDCNFDWASVAAAPEKEHLPATPKEEFAEKYLSAVKLAKSHGARVAVCTLVPIESKRFMNWVSRGLDRAGILGFLHGDVGAIGRWQESYSRLAEEVARAAGVPTLDLRSPFAKAPGGMEKLICADGIHPNAEGYRKLSQVFQRDVVAGII